MWMKLCVYPEEQSGSFSTVTVTKLFDWCSRYSSILRGKIKSSNKASRTVQIKENRFIWSYLKLRTTKMALRSWRFSWFVCLSKKPIKDKKFIDYSYCLIAFLHAGYAAN
jgi:hypothetical protein